MGDLKIETLDTIYFELGKLKCVLDCAIEESDLTETSNALKNLLSISYDYTEKVNDKIENLLHLKNKKEDRL